MAPKQGLSFYEYMFGNGVFEITIYLLKTFARPHFKRLTSKEWPQFMNGFHRFFQAFLVPLFLDMFHHTGLAIRLFGYTLTIEKPSLPNTCEACIATIGAKAARETWPCQRDAIYDWYKEAITGKVDVGTLLDIATVRAFLLWSVGAIAVHLLFVYVWGKAAELSWNTSEGAAQETAAGGHLPNSKLEEGGCAE